SGRKPYLRSVEKSYVDYVAGMPGSAKLSITAAPAPTEIASLEVPLFGHSAALSPALNNGRNTVARFLTASLRTLAQIKVTDVAVTVDSRWFDRSIAQVVGPLERVIPWDDVPLLTDDPAADCEHVNAKLERLCLHPRPLALDQDRHYRAFINLEFLMEPAWMGGEQWTAKGFVVESQRLPWVADVQIVPIWTREGLVVNIAYCDEAAAKALARQIVATLEYQ